MKINNLDTNEYLLGSYDEEFISEDSFSLRRFPSSDSKHIKNEKKVSKILSEINDDTEYNLYCDLRLRWDECMDKVMVHYRGNTKTAREVFEEVDKMSMAFDEMGLVRGNHIVACMSNVPEILTLLLTASRCGLVVNFISHKFDREYIRKVFAETPEKKLFIGTDDIYSKISSLVSEADFKDKVIVSLTDSLNGEDPYDKLDSKIYKFVNLVPYFKKKDPFIMSYADLLDISSKWQSLDNGFAKRSFYTASDAINMPLTITYSLERGEPKQIIHSNKSYVSMARSCDSDLSSGKKISNVVSLCYVPTYSNTFFSTGLVSILSQNGAVAFEPIYFSKFLLYSMAIYNPTNVYTTRSILIENAKQMLAKPTLAQGALENAYIISTVDELPSKNEEKFINEVLKKVNAGNKVLSFFSGSTVLSVMGGSLEFGNVFFTPLKEKQEKLSPVRTIRDDFGLIPSQLVKFAVLNDYGEELDYEQYGKLVIDSACSMLGYSDSYDNKMIKLMDIEGRMWNDTNRWAAILTNGNVLIKGRYDDIVELSNGQKVPYFMISDKLSEVDGLLSCEVVKPDDCDDALVAHIEFNREDFNVSPGWAESMLMSVGKKCQESFSEELADKIVFKVRPFGQSFPLTIDGRRDVLALAKEGIDDCYKPNIVDSDIELIPASTYFSKENRPKQKVKVNKLDS